MNCFEKRIAYSSCIFRDANYLLNDMSSELLIRKQRKHFDKKCDHKVGVCTMDPKEFNSSPQANPGTVVQ